MMLFSSYFFCLFFFNDTATTEIYTLSLHDALPILVIVRGDSHFAYPEVMQWIEAQADLSYVTGLTSNAVLHALAREVVEQAKRAYGRDGGKITRFYPTRYQAGTWSRSRRE